MAVAALILGCGAPAEKTGESVEKAQEEPTDRRFPLRGEVVGIDTEKNALRIAHEEIPGYMAAMTMRFPVLDKQVLEQVKEGDQVKGTLVVAPDNRYWLVDLEVLGEGAAEPKGEAAPEAEDEAKSEPEGEAAPEPEKGPEAPESGGA
jgi:Cu/Ag efflux protein CusF